VREAIATFWSVVRDTARLPLFNINYLTTSEALDVYNYTNSYPRRGLLGCLAVFLWKAAKSLGKKRGSGAATKGRIIIAVETHNQFSAVQPVHTYLGDDRALLLNIENQPGYPFPEGWAYFASLFFSPLVAFRAIGATPYQRLAYKHVLHQFMLTYGYYFVARYWLKKWHPKLLLVANDHNMKTRALAAAAAAEGVATSYIQHASVNDRFPPLCFNSAFLDGRDALEKYAAAGPSETTVFLGGVPKFDAHLTRVRQGRTVESLGVCIGRADPTQVVLELVTRLRDLVGTLPITLRPHPGDKRDWQSMLSPYRVGVSDSTKEVSFDFLAKVDAIVVADSNIALEALLLNVSALYFDFSGRKTDNYGFVRNGTVPYFSSIEDLIAELASLMRDRKTVRSQAAQYIATLGTPYDGRSAELVGNELIRQAEGQPPGPEWKRVQGSVLKAYEPAHEYTST